VNDQAVLQHKTTAPAVTIPSAPSSEELAFDWTLSEKDKDLVLKHRGPENLCRFAVQLCVLKNHGRFLSDYLQLPPAILGYLCQQLDIPPLARLPGRARGNTESDYQREIAEYLGWRTYDPQAAEQLRDWIADQVSQHRYIDDLVEKAANRLREQRIVIPGPVVFEREVNAAYRQAEGLVFQRIAEQIPLSMRHTIDRLLAADDADSKTDFMRFAEYPPEARAKHIVRYLDRYQELAALGIEQLRFKGIGRNLLQRLAGVVKTYDAWQIRRFDDDKRYALAACFLFEAKKTVLDYLVEMHAQFMLTMERRSRNDWEKEHRQLRRQVNRGIISLRQFASTALALPASSESPLERLFQEVSPETLRGAIQDCEAFEALQAYGYVNQLRSRYSNFRRYFPGFIHLDFHAEPAGQAVLDGIIVLRKLDSGELKALPEDVECSLVPANFRKRLLANPHGIDRRTWEIGLALALRDALRAGDIYLPDSRRHVSFWELCYDRSAWQQQHPAAYRELGLPVEADTATTKLVGEFLQTADRTAIELPSNRFAAIVDGQLQLKRDPAVEEPADTPLLRQMIKHHFSCIRIERLLFEVDGWCGFSNALRPLDREPSDVQRFFETRLAALVAHGTNLGIVVMADSAEGMTVDRLQDITRTCLREDAIRAANAILVNYIRRLKISDYWGDGRSSSSDGQRCGVQGSSLLASFYPRYFGYYDRAVTVYTHLSNQFSVFNTEVISCAEREALYVLDGLLRNESELDIEFHSTDTHGFTEQLFALCFLLGYSFMPRFKDLKKQKLYKPIGIQVHEDLAPLFSGAVDLDLIKEQWDSLVRVAASLKNRIVPAHVIAKRLISSGGHNRLANALTYLGRLLKTTYILRYLNDTELRRQVGLQLNRGESRQELADHVFFANQGEFRSGNYFEVMNKASCLSLLSNAILVYNTVHMSEFLEQAEAHDNGFSPATVAHVSPLQHGHIIVNGTYDFSSARHARANR